MESKLSLKKKNGGGHIMWSAETNVNIQISVFFHSGKFISWSLCWAEFYTGPRITAPLLYTFYMVPGTYSCD